MRVLLSVFSLRGGVNLQAESVQRLIGEFLTDLIDLVEAGKHVSVGIVDRATANRVVRVIADEQLPGLVYNRTGSATRLDF